MWIQSELIWTSSVMYMLKCQCVPFMSHFSCSKHKCHRLTRVRSSITMETKVSAILISAIGTLPPSPLSPPSHSTPHSSSSCTQSVWPVWAWTVWCVWDWVWYKIAILMSYLSRVLVHWQWSETGVEMSTHRVTVLLFTLYSDIIYKAIMSHAVMSRQWPTATVFLQTYTAWLLI